MTSVNETSQNFIPKLKNDNLNHTVEELIEDISVLEKSALDIEIETCENLLVENKLKVTLEANDVLKLFDQIEDEDSGKKNELCLFDENIEEFDISILEDSIRSCSPPMETEEKSSVGQNGELGSKTVVSTDVNLNETNKLEEQEVLEKGDKKDEPSLFAKNIDVSILEIDEKYFVKRNGDIVNLPETNELEDQQVLEKGDKSKRDKPSLFAKNIEVSILETEKKSSVEQNGDIGNKAMASTVVILPEANDLESEAEDINDPGWAFVKILKTNEERYQQVRNCWKSTNIPDPNRNLTYHSFRKRQFQNTKSSNIPRKRTATTNLDRGLAKRPRSCTYLYDNSIEFLKEKKRAYKNSMSNRLVAELQSGISRANNARDEVLQFFTFYKGFSNKDPTILTPIQLQEEEEIEKIYTQFDKLYK